MATAIPHAFADNFQRVAYDAATDDLVVVVIYRGTNPDHEFSLQWGPCEMRDGNQEIVGNLLDQQAMDAARKDFRKTLRFNLTGLTCRPAKVTLRTAPRFYITLQIPAARSAVTTR